MIGSATLGGSSIAASATSLLGAAGNPFVKDWGANGRHGLVVPGMNRIVVNPDFENADTGWGGYNNGPESHDIATVDRYSTEVLADAPKAYWRFGELSGTQATDSSGNGRHGTYAATPVYGTPGAIYRDENGCHDMGTPGTATIINVADHDDLSFTSNIFTMEFWVKFNPDYYSSGGGILYKGGGPWEYSIYKYNSSDLARFATWRTDGSNVVYQDQTQRWINDERWHHYAWAADGTNARLYVDGVLASTVAKTADNMGNTSQGLIIGQGGDAGEYNTLVGWIDEVALYNTALSVERVRVHYAAGIERAVLGRKYWMTSWYANNTSTKGFYPAAVNPAWEAARTYTISWWARLRKPSVALRDACGRSNEASPTGWIDSLGSGLQLYNRALQNTTTNANEASTWNTAMPTVDHAVEVIVGAAPQPTTPGTQDAYMILTLRLATANDHTSNHIEVYFGNDADDATSRPAGWFGIGWVNGGVWYDGGGWDVRLPRALQAGDVCRGQVVGNTVSLYFNGQLVWSVTMTSAPVTTGNYTGLFLFHDSSLTPALSVREFYAGVVDTGMRIRWNTNPSTTTILANPGLSDAWQRYAFLITWGGTVETPGAFFATIDTLMDENDLYVDCVQISEGAELVDFGLPVLPTWNPNPMIADGNHAPKLRGMADRVVIGSYQFPATMMVEFWFRIGSGYTTRELVIFSNRNVPTSTGQVSVGFTPFMKPFVWDNGAGGFTSSTGNYDDDQWHHYVYVNTNGTNASSFWIDGVQVYTGTHNRSASTGTWWIGWDWANMQQYPWPGYVDELAMFDSVTASAWKIARHYAARTISLTTFWENLLLYSYALDNAVWIKYRCSISANAIAAPDTTSTADKIVEDTSNNTHFFVQTFTSYSPSPTVTFSFYAKAAERSRLLCYCMFQLYIDGTYVTLYWLVIDVTLSGSGTINAATGSGLTAAAIASITDVGSGWYFVSISGTFNRSLEPGENAYAQFYLHNGTSTTYTGDGTSGLYVWGVNVSQSTITHPIMLTTSAQRRWTAYDEVINDDAPLAYYRLGDGTTTLAPADAWPGRPIVIELNGVSWREDALVDSLNSDDAIGQQMTGRFTLVNPPETPTVGSRVRVIYYSEVIFAGKIERIVNRWNNPRTAIYYDCECTDDSAILSRRKMRRTLVNVTLPILLESLYENELSEEGITSGTIDTRAQLALVDSKDSSVFDMLRDVAGITGQTFWLDFEKQLQFRSTTVVGFARPLTTETVEVAMIQEDMDRYRNVQTVICKGTPQVEGEEALETVQTKQNDQQIAIRQAMEGGSGRYEEIESITHPTSNSGAEIALLALSYARMRLAISGVPRRLVKCRVRGYGFRAGQVGTLTIANEVSAGSWVIQRASLREQSGNRLIYELELSQSSAQWRAFESWLRVMQAGKVTVQLSGTLSPNPTANLQEYTTQGNYNFVVPAGVTVLELTCVGASGGGGGGARVSNGGAQVSANGGRGGYSGRSVTVLAVNPGTTVSVTVGAAGTAGANASVTWGWGSSGAIGTAGTTGGHSSATYGGTVACQGNGGNGGTGGVVRNPYPGFPIVLVQWVAETGVDGAAGSGIGDGITIGGGEAGGVGGIGLTQTAPGPGEDGFVQIRY